MMRYLVLFALPFVADVYGKGKINNGYYLLCGEDHCRLHCFYYNIYCYFSRICIYNLIVL
jgi:hypothetical protein